MKTLVFIFLIVLSIIAALFFIFFRIENSSVVIKSQNKPYLIKAARYIEKIIYSKATKHNPEGDLVPDEIDDKLKEKLKEKLKDSLR